MARSVVEPTHDQLDAWARAALAGGVSAGNLLAPPVNRRAWAATNIPYASAANREDAINNAWIAWFTGEAKWDEVRHFSPWFNGVVFNKLSNLVRPGGLKISPTGVDGGPVGEPAAPADPMKPDFDDPPPRDWRADAERCWDGLEDEQRQYITWKFAKGWEVLVASMDGWDLDDVMNIVGETPSNAEIGEKVGLSEKKVQGRLYRAIRAFRECLGLRAPRQSQKRSAD